MLFRSKCMGMCVCPEQLDYVYQDLKSAKNPRYRVSAHWGYELKEAIKAGATVFSSHRYFFFAEKLFDGFITHFYNQRLREGQATDPETYERIPGAVPDELISLFCKLMMNSLYGKFGQALCSKILYCYSVYTWASKIQKEEDILNINVVPPSPGYSGHVQVTLLDSTLPYLGQCTFIPSFITAGARTRLLEYMRVLRHSCINKLGLPPQVYCYDTDSVQSDELDMTLAVNQQFKAQYCHNKKLGYMKAEHEKIGRAHV